MSLNYHANYGLEGLGWAWHLSLSFWVSASSSGERYWSILSLPFIVGRSGCILVRIYVKFVEGMTG